MTTIKELLPISNNKIGEEEVNAISARDLHKFLGVTERFQQWINKQLSFGFEENVDFVGCKIFNTLANLELQDYCLSLDCAKQVAMMQRNEKGVEARKYFIECEKQLKQALSSEEKLIATAVLSTTVEERVAALSEYQRVIVQPLIEFKEEALPKVNYHDKVLNSPDLMNISEIAKDYPISAIKLNKILQEEAVQYKDKKGEWALYAKYKDKGYATTKTQVIKNGEYEVLKVHLKWTQRGRLFIYELLKSKGILPICEKPC